MRSQDFINQKYSYAVVGATVHQEKYGYRVLKDFARAGYHVVGINPKYSSIDGIPVYATLKDVPGKVDVAIFVIPPDMGVHVLGQVEEKGISKVWFQPGAENDAIIEAVLDAGLTMNDPGSCIMVARSALQEASGFARNT